MLPIFTPTRLAAKRPKKLRRQMPFDLAEVSADSERLAHNETELLTQQVTLTHLIGKYERYRFDEQKKNLIRDIISIKSDGKVVVRTTKGLVKGEAFYTLNSVLSICLNELNGEPFAEQISCFVGRYEFAQITCLFALTLTVNSNNIPIAQPELLIPMQLGNSLPETFVVDSLEYFKLEKRYPDLVKYLQGRGMQSVNRVSW